MVEGDSDLELSDEENAEDEVALAEEEIESSEDEAGGSSDELTGTDEQENRRPPWAKTSIFKPVLPRPPDCQEDPTIHRNWSTIQYFSQYIDNKSLKTWQHSQIRESYRQRVSPSTPLLKK
ncbi:hypothetical protein QTP70_033296 [Hemibagrus guttatus]|uniref:PiggyBac transposable element-derived protein domain-containing protein n=1 Tax=Hemibagrus guttatus TaxID=175788 RepID=A0AAE0QCG4_9TELE|nr:hypothetical protein QTP70_033296 [Hemibagrus guttatus]